MPFGNLNGAQWRVMRRQGGGEVLLDGQGGDSVWGPAVQVCLRHVPAATGADHRGDARVDRHAPSRGSIHPRPQKRLSVPSRQVAPRAESGFGCQHVVTGDWNEALSEESTGNAMVAERSTNGNGSGPTLLQWIQVDDTSSIRCAASTHGRSYSMAFSPRPECRCSITKLSKWDSRRRITSKSTGWSKFAIREDGGTAPTRSGCARRSSALPPRPCLARPRARGDRATAQSDLSCRRYVDVAALRKWHASGVARTPKPSR